MDQITLAFQERTQFRKTASKKLRSIGKIPAVIYGQGKIAHISVESREFLKNFSTFGENTVIKLQSDKMSYNVLVKDFQESLITGRIHHIDFYHVSDTRPLHTKILLRFQGNPVGVRNGGLLEHNLYEVEVECLAKDLVHCIEVDVSGLDIGQIIYVGELPPPRGIKFLTHAKAIVAHVINAKGLASSQAPAAATVATQEKKV